MLMAHIFKAFESLQPDLKHVLQELLVCLLIRIYLKIIHLRKTRKRIHHLLLETLPAYKQVGISKLWSYPIN